VNSCEQPAVAAVGVHYYEVAEILSKKCTELGRNDNFPASYAFATKTFKIEQNKPTQDAEA